MSSFEEFFRDSSIEETLFFDEGPRISRNKPNNPSANFINTSSITTTQIDGFRQGVEMTQIKHFDAGLVKISAGEPGHVLRKNRFGMDKNFISGSAFQEIDLFEPVAFLRAQDIIEPLLFNILTFPIITGDNDQMENFNYNGVIEPFPIREIAAFFGIDAPFTPRGVRGQVMDGNLDTIHASDSIRTVDEFTPLSAQRGFLDMVDTLGNISLNGFFLTDTPKIKPFEDKRLPQSRTHSITTQNDMQAVMSLMSGSTGNYIEQNERSSTSGWVYDCNQGVGTDSLPFGGLCY